MTIHTDTRVVPVDDLTPWPKNPRRGNVDLIADSLALHGQYRPLVVRKATGEVLAGNHTLAAAKTLGWTEIAATVVDVDQETAERIVLIDNRANDVAGYDEEQLVEILQGLPDLDGTGYAQEDLDALIYGLDQDPEPTPPGIDEIPEVKPKAKVGDVFELGRHRVICGDSTEPETLATLMGEERAHAMWTDPPYGVEYVGKTKEALRIRNDGADDLEQLLTDAWAAVMPRLRPGAPVYVAHSDTRRVTFETTMAAAGFLVRQNLVWVKNVIVLGHSDYQYRHEPILGASAGEPDAAEEAQGKERPEHDPILYGFAGRKPGRLGRGGPYWFGGNSRSTVLEFPKPPASREHPTMKPVDLILAMLANSVRPGQLVLDPFGGSGSTLMAAEVHGADARLV